MRVIEVEESVVATSDDDTKKVSYERSSSSLSSTNSLSTGLFMRVHDLEFSDETRDTLCIDPDVNLLIEKLFKRGYGIVSASDDSGFVPTKDTAKVLRNRTRQDNTNWPIHPWNQASGKEVLLWTGSQGKKGFGHEWPMVKTRCLLKISCRGALDLLWDSKMVKNYNKMNVLRQDELIIQDAIDDMGCAKIVRSWNKPKWIPQTVETISLLVAKALPNGCYLLVSRSLWEGENFDFKPKPMGGKRLIRSEILVGVTLLRPVVDGNMSYCEMTSVTHIYSQALKRILAVRIAPASAVKMVKEMQAYIETNSLTRE